MPGGCYGSKVGALSCVSGGRALGEYLRCRAAPVHFTVGCEPVDQTTGGAASGAVVFAQHQGRASDKRGKDPAGICDARAGADPERRREAGAVAAAAYGRADHRRERHGDENLSSVPARGVPPRLSRHPHPHSQRNKPDGAGIPAQRAGGYRLCHWPAGPRNVCDAPLRRYAHHFCRRAGLSV